MPFDSEAVFRDATAGALNANGQSTVIDLKASGTRLKGLACVVICPTRPTDANETLAITIEESDDNLNWNDLVTFDLITQTLIPAASQGKPAGAHFIERFATRKRYVRLDYVVAGDTPNFGLVSAYLSMDGFQKPAGAY